VRMCILLFSWYQVVKIRTPSAAKTFGKFKDSFLSELHAEILLHVKQEATGIVPHPVEGITVIDSDVLEPAPIRPGGLQKPDTTVCNFSFRPFYLLMGLFSATPSDNQLSLWNHQLRELLSWAWTNWQRKNEQQQRRTGLMGTVAERSQGWMMETSLSSKVSHFSPLRSKQA